MDCSVAAGGIGSCPNETSAPSLLLLFPVVVEVWVEH